EALDRHVRMVLQRIHHCSLCRRRAAERGIACSAKDPGPNDVVFDWKPFQDAQRVLISAVDEVRILEVPCPPNLTIRIEPDGTVRSLRAAPGVTEAACPA